MFTQCIIMFKRILFYVQFLNTILQYLNKNKPTLRMKPTQDFRIPVKQYRVVQIISRVFRAILSEVFKTGSQKIHT